MGILLALDEVTVAINDAGYYAAHRLVSAFSPVDPDRIDELRSLRNRVIADDPDNRRRFHIRTDEVIRLAATLSDELPRGSVERRLMEEVERRTTDGSATVAWLEEAEQSFGIQLRRARRQRNSVAHGIRTVPAIAESVSSFLDRVAGRIIGLVWYSVEQEVDVIEAAESWRLAQLRNRESLRDGTPADEIFARAATAE
jgi:hypothetical protein